MKVLIPILIGLLVVGCGEVENGAYKHRPKQTDTNESTPTTNTNKADGTTAKPVKELTPEQKQKVLRDSAVGTYEGEHGEDTIVFLDNGVLEGYTNGKKKGKEAKWKIVDGKIHVEEGEEGLSWVKIYRINKGGSITYISYIMGGERRDWPKVYQDTFKKIK